MTTMATNAGRPNVRALVLLILTMLSYVVQSADEGHQLGSHDARRNLASANATVFDVMQFGAKTDGKTDNFESFVKAWKAACNASGAATLLIPKGTYILGPVVFQGPCINANPLTVEIQGTIQATTDISEYTSSEWVQFEEIDGLTITGGGTFDGQGAASWKYNDCKKKGASCQLLPTSIKLRRVKNCVFNRINSINAKSFHIFFTNSVNITAHDLNITAPANSPNTDGIHLSGSSFINISNSFIGTGDDCISIGQGSMNVSISNVFCGPGHGISIGSLGKYKDEEDVNGIYVTNCTLSETDNGVRIKTWAGSPPSQASNIIFEDIVMNMVKSPIIIDQKYSSRSNPKPSQVKISNVQYKNIRGTSISDVAVNLGCSSALPCEGVEMVDIDLAYKSDGKSKLRQNATISASCLHVKVKSSGKQNPPACP